MEAACTGHLSIDESPCFTGFPLYSMRDHAVCVGIIHASRLFLVVVVVVSPLRSEQLVVVLRFCGATSVTLNVVVMVVILMPRWL